MGEVKTPVSQQKTNNDHNPQIGEKNYQPQGGLDRILELQVSRLTVVGDCHYVHLE